MTSPAEARSPKTAENDKPIELDLLLYALPYPIFVLAEKNRIVFANAAAEVVSLLQHRRSEAPDARRIVGVRLPIAAPCSIRSAAAVRPSTSTASKCIRRNS